MGDIFVLSGSGLVKSTPTEFKVGNVYYYGGTIPASVIYITRIIDPYVYYIKLIDQLYYNHDTEFRETPQHLSAGVFSGERNMQKQANHESVQRILNHDVSGFDIPAYTTVEEKQEQRRKEQAEASKKPQARYIDTAEVSKLVKAKLQKTFPGVKFSVRSERYSGGSSIDVSWCDGPTTKEVESVAGMYHSASFDGMIDLASYHDTTDPDSGELVHYGNHYISFNRKYSKTSMENFWAETCAKYGFEADKATLKTADDHCWYEFEYGHKHDYQSLFNQIASETSLFKTESGAVVGEFKGRATITLPLGDNGFTFGLSKAQAILDHIHEIEQFVKDAGQC